MRRALWAVLGKKKVAPSGFTPSLDFSDARNSQYIPPILVSAFDDPFEGIDPMLLRLGRVSHKDILR